MRNQTWHLTLARFTLAILVIFVVLVMLVAPADSPAGKGVAFLHSPKNAEARGAFRPASILTATVTVTTTVTLPPTPTSTFNPIPGTATPTLSVVPTPPSCGSDWNSAIVPNVDESNHHLNSVAANSPTDVWAVGSYGGGNLIEHWNGIDWQVAPSAPVSGTLRGVAAVAPDDVWAVGFTGAPDIMPTSQHWNGTSWSPMPMPDLHPYLMALHDVAAVSANEVWAVGWIVPEGELYSHELILRWNGTEWQNVPGLTIPTGVSPDFVSTALYDVAAVGPNDVWAVGIFTESDIQRTLTLHWNGTTWTQVPSPNVGNQDNVLESVSGMGSTVWAVGHYLDPGIGLDRTLAMRWDGTQWQVVATPDPQPGAPQEGRGEGGRDPDPNLDSPDSLYGTILEGVAVASENEVWAVGHIQLGWPDNRTMILRWDGSAWTHVTTPSPGYFVNQLHDVAVAGEGTAWAVGHIEDAFYTDRTLVLQFGPPCGTPGPTVTAQPPTATSTAGTPAATTTLVGTATAAETATETATVTPIGTQATPTGTSQPPTDTPTLTGQVPTDTPVPASWTPTPTAVETTVACAIQYSDVQSGSTFYGQIMCLSCMGMVNGYADGTYRPGTNVTRGQLSKIVSNSAGLEGTPTAQTFEDVPATNTFYMYVERMAARGIISGYACGGHDPQGREEPCREGNRPYFRPGADATRGQISKIVANAADLNDSVVGQAFEDVPPTQPFYQYIQLLAQHSMMSGYPCGGPSEPCGQESRPYFRPAANATRGQVSKIVANTFYPECSANGER